MGAAPPLPPPLGARSAALARAQRRRARAATCAARQVHGAPRLPSARVRAPRPRLEPGALGARRDPVRGPARPIGALGAEATARLGWNAPPPASWKPLLALGRPPGVMPRAGIADAATAAAAAGRRVEKRRPLRREPAGPPRLSQSQSRDAVAPSHLPPPPPIPSGSQFCKVKPSGYTEVCLGLLAHA